MCADALGVPYQNAVVFEDAEAGIEAALSAGMYAIGIGEATQLPKAGFVIKNLSEMTLERLTFNY
jgi:beta-phosphoglucomutase